MSLDGQMEKLSALYDEKGDGELLDLFEQREGLTEVAQQALAGVMRRRGLETHGGGGAEEPESSAGGSAREVEEDRVESDEVLAYMFHDAFEAREAIRVLTEAGVAHRVLDWHVVQPERPAHPLGLDLGLVVGRPDLQRATAVLKEELGLYALPERGQERAEDVGDGDSMEVLSMYERGEALVAARALGEARMSYRWRDGSEVGSDLPDGESVVIEVNAEDVERAAQVVEDALGRR